MGRIAEKYSDIALVTDDNPRDEDAEKIRREIIKKSKQPIIQADDLMEAATKSVQICQNL